MREFQEEHYNEDMGEYFRDLKEHYRKRREENWRKADPTGWTVHSPYHWQQRLLGDLLDYWPTRNKWRWRNKTYHGNVREFINARTADRPGPSTADGPREQGDSL